MKAGKLLRDLRLKNGDTLISGSTCRVEFLGSANHLSCKVYTDQKGDLGRDYSVDPINISVRSLPGLVSGFKMPTHRSLEKWSMDSVCLTPSGKRVEPDGFGPDGSPSWLLVLGFI